MSNIYIQEPPTYGKVLLVTTVGEVEVELWSKEAPKACRNFVQLCLEGYYDGTIFHRLVPNFIVQGGDPTGTGCGGESIYGKPFQDEFHSRLRFVRRGLVAMANCGQHDNASQFFFTLAATPELNNKHTVFGKIGGNTIYNMLKLGEGEIDSNERPVYPHKITKTKIILNPFDDIVPRAKKSKSESSASSSKKSDIKAEKNFKLLSFGEEAEEEEREVSEVAQALRAKGKSSHDLLRDNTLSSVPAVDVGEVIDSHSQHSDLDREADYKGRTGDDSAASMESVRKKLKVDRDKPGTNVRQPPQPTASGQDVTASDEHHGGSSKSESSRIADLKAESKRLKQELAASRSKKAVDEEQKKDDAGEEETSAEASATATSEISAFRAERRKYKEQSQKLAKKGSARESETLKILAAFQAKMDSAKKLAHLVSGSGDEKEEDADGDDDDDDDDATDMSWTHHTLRFDADANRKVLDANVHDVDRYEIFDPRNPLNVRRREASAKAMKEKR